MIRIYQKEPSDPVIDNLSSSDKSNSGSESSSSDISEQDEALLEGKLSSSPDTENVVSESVGCQGVTDFLRELEFFSGGMKKVNKFNDLFTNS
ncbi:unnamed protein product [Lepeophtheirus salmonis]|uniref:(salmon louse) hypothetical protein n=1 Tax=Lepeophtheirus salmonis TaxID=72036 RepID=A0A7R8CP57_LEPSM|nr:unnamed protein product [Lepeophtheirus salmonis]CAF2878466.1 unnamed protein product [Lepeophtheirus salmonis]